MRNLVALVPVWLLFAAPAAAQTPDVLDSVALIIGGLVDGQSTRAGGPAVVTKTGPGVYVTTPAQGEVLTFTVAEPEKCVFTVKVESPSAAPVTVHFDANKLRNLGVLPLESNGGLSSYNIVFSGDAGRFEIESAKGTSPLPVDIWPVITSVDLKAVETAILAIRTACPGLAQ